MEKPHIFVANPVNSSDCIDGQVYGERVMTDKEIKAHEVIEPDLRDYQAKRSAEYLPVGDQLDAILKSFNNLRFEGESLPDDLDAVVNHWLGVKKKHPKPVESDLKNA